MDQSSRPRRNSSMGLLNPGTSSSSGLRAIRPSQPIRILKMLRVGVIDSQSPETFCHEFQFLCTLEAITFLKPLYRDCPEQVIPDGSCDAFIVISHQNISHPKDSEGRILHSLLFRLQAVIGELPIILVVDAWDIKEVRSSFEALGFRHGCTHEQKRIQIPAFLGEIAADLSTKP